MQLDSEIVANCILCDSVSIFWIYRAENGLDKEHLHEKNFMFVFILIESLFQVGIIEIDVKQRNHSGFYRNKLSDEDLKFSEFEINICFIRFMKPVLKLIKLL